jgi:hypothetical protein
MNKQAALCVLLPHFPFGLSLVNVYDGFIYICELKL